MEMRKVTEPKGPPQQSLPVSISTQDLVKRRLKEWTGLELIRMRQAKMQEQRLRPRDSSVCDRIKSTDDVDKDETSPERERRGKSVVWSTPIECPIGVISQKDATMPAVTAPRQTAALQTAVVQAADVSVGLGVDDGDSDDPDMDRIKSQRLRVKFEIERLVRYQSDYARKMAVQRRKR